MAKSISAILPKRKSISTTKVAAPMAASCRFRQKILALCRKLRDTEFFYFMPQERRWRLPGDTLLRSGRHVGMPGGGWIHFLIAHVIDAYVIDNVCPGCFSFRGGSSKATGAGGAYIACEAFTCCAVGLSGVSAFDCLCAVGAYRNNHYRGFKFGFQE